MNATIALPLAYRVLGPLCGRRRVVGAVAAFAGYAACDPRAQVELEGHLSGYSFGSEFGAFVQNSGSTRGFDGACWAAWTWFDIDRRDDLPRALADACHLTTWFQDQFNVAEDELLAFYSGKKGVHIGLSTALWSPEPSLLFDRVTRQFAESIAASAAVQIDTGIYCKVACLRAPNSCHPVTGLHKRRLDPARLSRLTESELRKLAAKPAPFEIPVTRRHSTALAERWAVAVETVERNASAAATRHQKGHPALNRRTLDFICGGAPEGERARRLFSAAANLAEFDCSLSLAHALLFNAACDSGLPPSEARREIDRGFGHGAKTLNVKEVET